MATISKTIRGHVIELAPTGEQIVYFKKACGTARFAYNWGLSTWNRMWKEYKRGDLGTDGKRVPKPNEALIRKMLNELKKDKYPWMYDVTKCAPQQAIKNLGRAFERWWKKLGKRPKHHSKRKHNSFYIENSHVTLDNEARTVKIPNMESLVHLKERLRFKGRILSTTIFLQAGRWFMSFAVEVEQTILPRSSSYAGFAVPAEENQTAGGASACSGAT